MLSVISPAKTLDFESPAPSSTHTLPEYLDASAQLIDRLRKLSPQQLAALMGISDKLATLNANRYVEWSLPFSLGAGSNPAKQAIFAFQGDVYTGLEAQRLNATELERAQQRLRILSGLYGMLRPLDLIQPYRLEMGIRLDNPAGATLYDFWRERLTHDLAKAVAQSGTPVLINLASNEYFKVIDAKRLGHRIVTPVFKDEKNGKLKVISFYAKKARGWMSAWILRHDIDDPEALKAFDIGGYEFDPSLSKQDEWVFTRPEQ